MNILCLIVENIENEEMLAHTLRSLGAKHVSYGVVPPYFHYMGDVLLISMREFFEHKLERHSEEDEAELEQLPHWTEDVERAWRSAYSLVAGLMLEG